MPGVKTNPRIAVSPKKDWVVITVEGFEVEATVRPVWKSLSKPGSTGLIVESIRLDLAPFLKDLNIDETSEGIVVKPKRFLGRSFTPVAEIVEYYGGSYVSGGRESRFIIPVEDNGESQPE